MGWRGGWRAVRARDRWGAAVVAGMLAVLGATVVSSTPAGAGPATTFQLTSIDDPITEDRSDTFFTLRAVDSNGAVDTSYGGTVRFTSTDPGATVPPDVTFFPDDGGVKTFSGNGNLVWGTPGEQTLTATDTANAGITGSRANVTVRSDAPTAIELISLDDPITEERSDSFFEVRMVNAFGEASLQADGHTVHFTSNDPQATLPPDFTYQADNGGRMTFSGNNNLVWATPGERTLTATDTADASITGSRANITVRSDAPVAIELTSIDDPIPSGQRDTFFEVFMVNAFGEASLQATGHTVHFTSTDPQASLPADFTYQADNRGRKTFADGGTSGASPGNLVWRTPGEQTLTATDTGQSSITGNRPNITVTGDQQQGPTTTTTTAPPGTTTTTAPSGGTTTTTTPPPSGVTTTTTAQQPGATTTTSTTPQGAVTSTTSTPAADQSVGPLAPGEPRTIRSCGFVPGSTVRLGLNGEPLGNDSVAGDGCTSQVVELSAGGTALGSGGFAVVGLRLAQADPAGRPTVNIDGRVVPAVFGTNVLAASGTAAQGAPRVVTSTFDVPRPSAVINRTLNQPAAAARAAAGEVAQEVARTGARVFSPVGLAALLLMLGQMMVSLSNGTRRRRSVGATRAATAMGDAFDVTGER